MRERPLTLCLLNYEYPPIGGGAASATREMAKSLSRMGHHVIVVSTGIGDLVGERYESGLRIIRLACQRKRADGASLAEMFSFMMAASRRLPEIVRKTACDGVICFFTVPCGPAAWLTWKKTGVPYVISMRGGDVPGLEPSLNSIHYLLTPFRRVILKHSIAVVGNSEVLKKLSEASDPVPVHVIPNGVDTATFSPTATLNDRSIFRVLAVGRLRFEKNHAFALRVLAAARQQSGCMIEYHVVGDGPLKAELVALANELGLNGQVIWHGWLPREKLVDIYRSCDCLLHPSLYESMPNAVLEAMASGLAVVASDVPGNARLVRHGQTGYTCQLGDVTGFATLLTRLAEDPSLREALGKAARAVVESEYSWDAASSLYADLFLSRSASRGDNLWSCASRA